MSVIHVCMCFTHHGHYRHSDQMIEKLENAGLGFYVRVTETQQKLGETVLTACYECISVHVLFLGKIPLRQLVYRVLDLPPSMAPLVYDFGQLNTGTEYDYTSQIVKDHVRVSYSVILILYLSHR